jgi:hypothetical protein
MTADGLKIFVLLHLLLPMSAYPFGLCKMMANGFLIIDLVQCRDGLEKFGHEFNEANIRNSVPYTLHNVFQRNNPQTLLYSITTSEVLWI